VIRTAIRAVDPELPIASVATLETIVDEAMARPRFSAPRVAVSSRWR
jgi:hypothetical protein